MVQLITAAIVHATNKRRVQIVYSCRLIFGVIRLGRLFRLTLLSFISTN